MWASVIEKKTSKRRIYSLFVDKTELFAEVIARHRDVVLDLPQPPGKASDLDIRGKGGARA